MHTPDPNIYELNRQAFLAHAPALSEHLPRAPDEPPLVPIRTRSGAVTAELDGVLLHSKYHPVREAQRLAELPADSQPACCVMYGLGLGYAAEAFVARYPELPLLVVEPESGLFRRTLMLRDLRGLPRGEVRLLVGAPVAAVERELDRLPAYRARAVAHVMRQRATYPRNQPYYEQIDAVLARRAMQRDINRNTLQRFGRRWVRNLLSNVELVFRAPGVVAAGGHFANLPAVVLAAGPSLEEVLPLLPRLRERALIVAVDTALRPCLRAGVEPDFLVVVDPQYWNSRHLDRCRLQRTILVSETSTLPSVFRALPLPTLLASSLFPLGQYIESLAGAKGELGAGGSVATTAWDFARYCGCTPIVMAGLDLGYPANRTHCSGTFFEELRIQDGARLGPAATAAFSYQYGAEPFMAAANAGPPTMTDRRMQIYRWWFESQMQLHPRTRTVAVAPRAVAIRGMQFLALDQLELPPQRERIDGQLAQVRDAARRARSQPPDVTAVLQRLEAGLAALEAVCGEALDRTRELELLAARRAPLDDALHALDAIDQRIAGSAEREMVGFLIQAAIDEVHEGAGRNAAADVIARSRALYTSVRESARFHRDETARARRMLSRTTR